MAPLTALQAKRTGEVRFFAPSAGARSVGPSAGQFCDRATVKLWVEERSEGHPSKTASTCQLTTLGGSVPLTDVSVVLAITLVSPPSNEACTRYSVAFGTALQESVTGEATVALSAGEMICGRELEVGHPGVGMTKLSTADRTAGQFSKYVSTNQRPLPVAAKSCCRCVSLENPTSANASPLRETHTR